MRAGVREQVLIRVFAEAGPVLCDLPADGPPRGGGAPQESGFRLAK